MNGLIAILTETLSKIPDGHSVSAMIVLIIAIGFSYGHLNYAMKDDVLDLSSQITALSIKNDINYTEAKIDEIKKDINIINNLPANEITSRDVKALMKLKSQLKLREAELENLNVWLGKISPKYKVYYDQN